MAYTTIDDPSAYFQIALWTGDGSSSNAITNAGNSDLQPDWIWIKDRSATNGHGIQDTSRGIVKVLFANGTDTEDQYTNTMVSSVQSDGFTVPNNSNSNTNTNNYVAWQWKANGGSTTTNDTSATGVGDQDSVYQANTTAGFSIVTWTGDNSVGANAHGLGVVPHLIIVKCRSDAEPWEVYHHKNTSAPETDYLRLNTTAATADDSTRWNDTAPTSTVFTVGDTGSTNEVSKTYVAYLFSEIQGYSKFGSYTGNGNADGPFVYTGFSPAWLMVKKTNDAKGWHIHDSDRPGYNPSTNKVSADSTAAEATSSEYTLDLLSNGFKLRSSDNEQNGNTETWVYAAFAHQPFVTSGGVPCTAF